jgi:mannose/fructose/N-acetylgalactosamine-specific phosphotransferase system component IIC
MFSIASKFTVVIGVAISASSLCINRRLYHIASIRVVTTTKADRRRAIMVDLAIGLGIPVLVMLLRMFLYLLRIHSHFSDQDFQTTSFKAIDSTSLKTMVAPLPLTTFGPYFPFSSCHL